MTPLKEQIQDRPIREQTALLADCIDALSQAATLTLDDELAVIDLADKAAEYGCTVRSLVTQLHKAGIPVIELGNKRQVRAVDWRRALITCFSK